MSETDGCSDAKQPKMRCFDDEVDEGLLLDAAPEDVPRHLVPSFVALVQSPTTGDTNGAYKGIHQIRKLLSLPSSSKDAINLVTEIIQSGVVSALVQWATQSDNAEIQVEASWALSNLSCFTDKGKCKKKTKKGDNAGNIGGVAQLLVDVDVVSVWVSHFRRYTTSTTSTANNSFSGTSTTPGPSSLVPESSPSSSPSPLYQNQRMEEELVSHAACGIANLAADANGKLMEYCIEQGALSSLIDLLSKWKVAVVADDDLLDAAPLTTTTTTTTAASVFSELKMIRDCTWALRTLCGLILHPQQQRCNHPLDSPPLIEVIPVGFQLLRELSPLLMKQSPPVVNATVHNIIFNMLSVLVSFSKVRGGCDAIVDASQEKLQAIAAVAAAVASPSYITSLTQQRNVNIPATTIGTKKDDSQQDVTQPLLHLIGTLTAECPTKVILRSPSILQFIYKVLLDHLPHSDAAVAVGSHQDVEATPTVVAIRPHDHTTTSGGKDDNDADLSRNRDTNRNVVEAMWIVSNIAGDEPSHIQHLVKGGFLPIIVAGLTSQHRRQQVRHHQQVGGGNGCDGGIRRLVSTKEDDEMGQEAFWAATNIITTGNPKQVEDLISCGALEALIVWVQDRRQSNLSKFNERYRDTFLEAVQMLIEKGDTSKLDKHPHLIKMKALGYRAVLCKFYTANEEEQEEEEETAGFTFGRAASAKYIVEMYF